MTESYAAANGELLSLLTIYVPNRGPWVAECMLIEGDEALSGAIEVTAGELTLTGTARADASGEWREQSKSRIVAGGGGWGTVLPPKGYANDAGVKAWEIAGDAARACSETLDVDSFEPERERIGSKYVRQVAAASQALEDAIGSANWWVAYDGTTHVGSRTVTAAAGGSYEVLQYDPMHRTGTLHVDDLSAIGIGTQLVQGFDPAVTVRDMVIHVTPDDMWIEFRVDDPAEDASRATRLLRDVARTATRGQLFGLWKYRATRMVGDRVELQAVSADDGLPDLLQVEMWAGPGIHANVTPGCEVLVQFVGGRRSEPVVTHYAPKGAGGFVPVSLELAVDPAVGGLAVARQGDLVQCGGVGTQVTFTGPGPNMQPGVPYLVSFSVIPPSPLTADPLYGAISTGSQKVSSG